MAAGYLGRNLIFLLLTVGLASCTTVDESSDNQPSNGNAMATTLNIEAPVEDTSTADAAARAPQLLQMGSDQAVSMPAPRPPITLEGEAVSLDFEETPLVEIVHAVLGDILELDYVIEHPINGQVTLRTRSPIPRDELLPILESLLQSNDAIMVRDPNDRYFVSASKRLTSLLPEFSSPETRGAGFVNIVVPLQYISASEMMSILKPVATDGAFVRVDNLRNLLVLAGTRNQLDGWLQIINTFDIDQLAGMSVAVFPLQYSSIEIVDAALAELLGGGSMESIGEGESIDGGGSGAALGGLVRILPLEGLDSLMVISPRLNYIEQIGNWIRKLDQPRDASGEPTLHVYQVENGDASQMAELLSGLLGGSGGTSGGADAGVAPGLTPMSTGGGQGSGAAQGSGAGRNNSRQGAGQQFTVGDDIRVVADRYNNSLLIYAPQREYRKIETALRKLDVVPKQVLIEASILEVQLIGNLRYGIEWAFNDSVGDLTGNGLLARSDDAIGPLVPGFSYTLTDTADAVRAVVNALAEDSLVNVISTPSVMVLDNHTASINVGDQQPIQSAQTVSNGGNITQSIEFKDTGVQLEVTPTVNSGGLVTMDISQSVTDVGPVDSATGQRSFLNRDVASRVAIRSGESVVLGGLIRDNSTKGNSGIPLLKDIPGVGAFFSSNTETSTRTELLVFITPRVMRNQADLRDISREMRDRMQGIQYFGDLPLSARPPASSAATSVPGS